MLQYAMWTKVLKTELDIFRKESAKSNFFYNFATDKITTIFDY